MDLIHAILTPNTYPPHKGQWDSVCGLRSESWVHIWSYFALCTFALWRLISCTFVWLISYTSAILLGVLKSKGFVLFFFLPVICCVKLKPKVLAIHLHMTGNSQGFDPKQQQQLITELIMKQKKHSFNGGFRILYLVIYLIISSGNTCLLVIWLA